MALWVMEWVYLAAEFMDYLVQCNKYVSVNKLGGEKENRRKMRKY